jgi:nucleotide-binding universal stress UspA family protein
LSQINPAHPAMRLIWIKAVPSLLSLAEKDKPTGEQPMDFGDIIVHVDASDDGSTRARIAARLAELHHAHVTGLFVREPLNATIDLSLFTDSALQSEVYQRELQRAIATGDTMLHNARETFNAVIKPTAIAADWLVVDGGSPAAIDAAARFADLVIVGQDNRQPRRNPAAELALSCGRPVLAVPRATATDTLGTRILIAWNGSREAARAVGDAMPFLKRAAFVAVLSVEPPWREIAAGMEELSKLSRHLEHCGVAAERFVVQAAEHAAGDEIIARANNADCDLIVMGAYGHSHMRELVLGGASRSILAAMPMPVLLSH